MTNKTFNNPAKLPKNQSVIDSLNKLESTIKTLNRITAEYNRIKSRLMVEDSLFNADNNPWLCKDSIVIKDAANKILPFRDSLIKTDSIPLKESIPNKIKDTIMNKSVKEKPGIDSTNNNQKSRKKDEGYLFNKNKDIRNGSHEHQGGIPSSDPSICEMKEVLIVENIFEVYKLPHQP